MWACLQSIIIRAHRRHCALFSNLAPRHNQIFISAPISCERKLHRVARRSSTNCDRRTAMSNNPYTPPTAEVRDRDPERTWIELESRKLGRVDRFRRNVCRRDRRICIARFMAGFGWRRTRTAGRIPGAIDDVLDCQLGGWNVLYRPRRLRCCSHIEASGLLARFPHRGRSSHTWGSADQLFPGWLSSVLSNHRRSADHSGRNARWTYLGVREGASLVIRGDCPRHALSKRR